MGGMAIGNFQERADLMHDRIVSSDANDWVLVDEGIDPAREPWAETLFALANGTLGVRGTLAERIGPRAATFLAAAYETVPIHYHERLKGFASATDTRIPVADGTAIEITVNGTRIGEGAPIACERRLDLRTGLLTRHTTWPSPAGPIAVTEERLVPFDAEAVVVMRFTIAPLQGQASIAIASGLFTAESAIAQGDDPRIGARGIEDAVMIEAIDPTSGSLMENVRHSGIRIISALAHRPDAAAIVSDRDGRGLSAGFESIAAADAPFVLTKAVAYRTAAADPVTDDLLASARTEAEAAARLSFDALIARQRTALDAFWGTADIAIDGDPAALRALRVNMFHVFQSSGRDGRTGITAKGLTGEGYEGHVFWDGEVFVLPMLVCTAPVLARAALDYRYATLEAARDNARALDHATGALFAWRTIAGHECSAHYPSGSAQYHINADVAFAIRLYDAATGDTQFLIDKGGEMLAETARIWLQVGHVADDGSFRIHGVTGPDEYTALIDNNWYTNRMAQVHLRFAADVADRLALEASGAWAAVTARIGLTPAEIASWRAAAAAMHLPFDAARDLDAQDDSFLDKPRWDIAGTPPSGFPLLLHNHPMTLYRHQVAKQADLVLALVLAGETVSLTRKHRAFDHYSMVTVHDSTLSDCSFSILASEVGDHAAAMRHFRAAAFIDVEDRHGNSHHGAHMAAMAGSWQALVWGFGGFRAYGQVPYFSPVLPEEWTSYAFTMRWRGTRFRVAVERSGTTCRHLDGPALTIDHRGETVTLTDGEERQLPGPVA